MIAAYFIQGDKVKRNELLTRSHELVDNIERDLQQLSVDGNPETYTVEQFKEKLAVSKAVIDNMAQVNFMISSGDPTQIASALDRLRQMFEIIDCVEGTQCHELEDTGDHIRRIFDQTQASQAFECFYYVLEQEDSFEVA